MSMCVTACAVCAQVRAQREALRERREQNAIVHEEERKLVREAVQKPRVRAPLPAIELSLAQHSWLTPSWNA